MNSDSDDFVTIRPRQAPISTDGPAPAPTQSPRKSRPIGLVLGFAALLLAAAWVFIFLPERVPEVATPTTVAKPASRTDAAPAPFESIKFEQERKAAQSLLGRFVELQIRLDDEMQVAKWAPDAFVAAQQLANEGDQRFRKENFAAAMSLYEEGIRALEALVADGQARFDAALGTGLTALARGDSAAALEAFETAAMIHPQDARLVAARERARVRPEVVNLRRSGELAVAEGKWTLAIEHYQKALALDATQSDLNERIAGLRQQLADAQFAARLSAGYAALDAGDIATARAAFTAAARERPGDRAAQDGLAQVDQTGTLRRIEATRQRAEALARAEDWEAAAKAYAEVLSIDPTIKFARDGRSHAESRAELDAKLREALADPAAMSSDEVFRAAVAVYDKAVDVRDRGPKLEAQLDALEAALAVASRPIPVRFTSDAATEVTVYRIGSIGRFSEKQIELRPGRYSVIGSRPGRRDVRLEVIVAPGMAAIDVRCTELI